MIKILKSSDLAIVPNTNFIISEKYTSPLKIFEYLASSLPIISSDLPAMRELLKNEVNCLFFESGNPDDLARKINLLYKNKKLLSVMSENNYNLSRKYSWNERAQKIIETIEKF